MRAFIFALAIFAAPAVADTKTVSAQAYLPEQTPAVGNQAFGFGPLMVIYARAQRACPDGWDFKGQRLRVRDDIGYQLIWDIECYKGPPVSYPVDILGHDRNTQQ